MWFAPIGDAPLDPCIGEEEECDRCRDLRSVGELKEFGKWALCSDCVFECVVDRMEQLLKEKVS